MTDVNRRGPKPQFSVEETRIIFRNFAGKQTQFNSPGDRNFGLVLPPDLAEQLARDGWPVKTLAPRDESDVETYFVKVKVKYEDYPPKIVMLTNNGKTRTFLNDSTVEVLDYSDIVEGGVDITVSGYNWKNAKGETGLSCYVKTMYVNIDEDDIERKYGASPGNVEAPSIMPEFPEEDG